MRLCCLLGDRPAPGTLPGSSERAEAVLLRKHLGGCSIRVNALHSTLDVDTSGRRQRTVPLLREAEEDRDEEVSRGDLPLFPAV